MRKLAFIVNHFTQNVTSHPEIPLLCFLNAELQLAGTMGEPTGPPIAPAGCNTVFATACRRIHRLAIKRPGGSSPDCL